MKRKRFSVERIVAVLKQAELGTLAPDRLAALRRVATIESIGSSTRIEGSKLSDREVEQLHQILLRCSEKDTWHRGSYKTNSNSVAAFESCWRPCRSCSYRSSSLPASTAASPLARRSS